MRPKSKHLALVNQVKIVLLDAAVFLVKTSLGWQFGLPARLQLRLNLAQARCQNSINELAVIVLFLARLWHERKYSS